MPQVLIKDTKKLSVDQTFVDGGDPARYGIVAGERVLLREGRPPKPTIHRKGTSFFYDDGQFVTVEEDVEHLPTKVKVQALEFIRAQAKGLKPKHVTPRTPRMTAKKRRGKIVDFDPAVALGREALVPARV